MYEKGNESSTDDESDEERICKMLGEVTENNIKLTKDDQNCGEEMITDISKNKNSKGAPIKTKKKTNKRKKTKKKMNIRT